MNKYRQAAPVLIIDKQRIIRAHIAGDSNLLISVEQNIPMAEVQQIVDAFDEEDAATLAEFKRVDAEAGLNARRDGNVPLTDAQHVIQLYRETELSTSEIARQLKLKVEFVKSIIATYDAQLK